MYVTGKVTRLESNKAGQGNINCVNLRILYASSTTVGILLFPYEGSKITFNIQITTYHISGSCP